jgi:hypothetical protein
MEGHTCCSPSWYVPSHPAPALSRAHSTDGFIAITAIDVGTARARVLVARDASVSDVCGRSRPPHPVRRLQHIAANPPLHATDLICPVVGASMRCFTPLVRSRGNPAWLHVAVEAMMFPHDAKHQRLGRSRSAEALAVGAHVGPPPAIRVRLRRICGRLQCAWLRPGPPR